MTIDLKDIQPPLPDLGAPIVGYTVWITNMLASGYVIDHGARRVLFSGRWAVRVCRRARRWTARSGGRRRARGVPEVPFHEAFAWFVERGKRDGERVEIPVRDVRVEERRERR